MKRLSLQHLLLVLVSGGMILALAGCGTASPTSNISYTTAQVTRGTLTVGVSAAGTLSARQLATLVWKTSGTVDKVLIQPGDTVKAGAVLMTLAQDSWERSVKQAVADLESAQQALDTLLSGPDPQTLAQARLSYVQAKQNVPTAATRLRSALYYEGRTLLDAYLDAWKAYVDAEESDSLTDTITQTYTDARTAWEAATLDGPDVDRIELYKAQFDVALASFEKAREALADALAGPSEAEILAAQARVEAAQDTLDLARLSAPFDGTVISVSLAPGDKVSQNTQALILADLSAFTITVDVSEVDVSSISVGQKAEVSFDAFPDETFTGTVREVGFVGANQQGVVYYPVTVELPPDPRFRPGMTAAVRIVTAEHEAVLMVPNRAIKQSNGQPYVTLQIGEQMVQVPVTVGLINESYSEILSGDVQEGDTLIIFSSSGNTSFTGGGMGGGLGLGGIPGGRP